MKKPHSRGSTNNKGGTYREGAKDQLTFEEGMCVCVIWKKHDIFHWNLH